MKYNIEGFDQQQLVNMGLNANDAVILRWFVDFYSTNKMAQVTADGVTYKWVKYQAVIDDLPILGIKNKQVIARHFDKMVKAGIIEKYIKKQDGIYTCFRLTEKYRVLIEKLKGVDSKVETPIDSKVETKDSSIKLNSSIKTLSEADTSFNTFWQLYDKKTNHKKCLAKWQKINPELHDTIFNHVKEYVKSTPDKKFRKNPETYLNNSGWEDEIVYPKGVPKPVETQQDDFKKLCEENKKYFE